MSAELSDEKAIALLDEVVLDLPRRGRAAQPLTIEIVRPLTVEDVKVINSAPKLPAKVSALSLRHSHHLLARLLAEGVSQAQASLITGYTPSWISVLKADPAFKDLLDYYAKQKEQIWADVIQRMRVLGLSTLDELQRRLEENPNGWAKRELMELAELLLVKGQSAGTPRGAPASGAPSVDVRVTFVSAKPPADEPLTVDGRATEIKEVQP